MIFFKYYDNVLIILSFTLYILNNNVFKQMICQIRFFKYFLYIKWSILKENVERIVYK